MGKLHEVLAVLNDLRQRADAATKVARARLDNIVLLKGQVRSYRPLDDEGEELPEERQELASTVDEALGEFASAFGAWVDAEFQKEITNRSTSADVVVDGKVLFKDIPAPALLNLESKLAGVRGVYAAIPTLDMAEQWQYDEGRQCYVSAPRITYRTQKRPKSLIGYEATKEHPAQVQWFQEDIRVGEWTTVIQSGSWTPTRKRETLERVDALLDAVKQARQRANDVEASNAVASKVIFKYINS